MATATYRVNSPRRPLTHHWRVLRTIAAVEFKAKYVDSLIGYVWSIVRPLAYFGVLWVVFGRFFRTGLEDFPLYLLIGIVLYAFFIDAVGTALPSIVNRGSMLRRMAFPPLVIPLASTLTASITFGVNLIVVAVFVALSDTPARAEWLLVVPLLLELYLFVLGVGLILSTLFVRFRDIGHLWELTAQLLIFAAPIMYPLTFLPSWAEKLAFLNPFVQIVQDVRVAVVGGFEDQTITAVYGTELARLLPIAIVFVTLLVGLWLFRRDAPRFAERV
jgi:ABC-2 type transport system permease protein